MHLSFRTRTQNDELFIYKILHCSTFYFICQHENDFQFESITRKFSYLFFIQKTFEIICLNYRQMLFISPLPFRKITRSRYTCGTSSTHLKWINKSIVNLIWAITKNLSNLSTLNSSCGSPYFFQSKNCRSLPSCCPTILQQWGRQQKAAVFHPTWL